MKIKQRWPVGVLLVVCMVGGIVWFTPTTPPYRVEAYAVEGGWGYRILQDQKTVIDQPFVPVRAARQPFHSETQALQTARLVVAKLESHQFPPRLSAAELDSLEGKR
ncbi:protein of unknown function [Catalinimonas alkaloidigena]|uniref:DUF4907 domain-containing protein n=1 Tax=Catalinimonas alkaloidigena TaxID=1075417 RepID=A0A1G9GLG3_9BACT|nr:DUF4907 domain-containing protein [Catalinimonas alkaloidigena]SDL01538.1 protein of unknown function [Catalinimonas alkaloidigena]